VFLKGRDVGLRQVAVVKVASNGMMDIGWTIPKYPRIASAAVAKRDN
jgi:hypothetical protein